MKIKMEEKKKEKLKKGEEIGGEESTHWGTGLRRFGEGSREGVVTRFRSGFLPIDGKFSPTCWLIKRHIHMYNR